MIDATVARVIEHAKLAKEAWVEGAYPLPEVGESLVERDELAVRLFPGPKETNGEPYNSRDHLLEITYKAIVGLRATRATVISDSYKQLVDFTEGRDVYEELCQSKFNGSMAAAFAAGKANDFCITEAMVAFVMTATPGEEMVKVEQANLSYELSDGKITWTDEWVDEFDGNDEKHFGAIADALRGAFQEEDLMSSAKALFADEAALPPEFWNGTDTRFRADVAVFVNIAKAGGVFVLQSADRALLDRYSERLEHWGISTHIKHRSRAERRRAKRRHN